MMALDIPYADDLDRRAEPKPMKGAGLLESRERRADRVSAEQREMQAALRRDERKCRVPRCEYRNKNLPIDACHFRGEHRGMGGNPAGDRTERKLVFAACRVHHGLYDGHLLDAQPLSTDEVCDGLLVWYRRQHIDDPWEHFATEQRIGVTEMRT